MLIHRNRFVPALWIAALACASTTGPTTTFHFRVLGTVRDSTDRPIGTANVVVTGVVVDGSGRVHIGSCSGGPAAPVVTSTTNDGKFAATLVRAGAPAIACIAVQVTPPAGSGLQPATVSGNTVFIGPAGSGPDSVVLDVRLSR